MYSSLALLRHGDSGFFLSYPGMMKLIGLTGWSGSGKTTLLARLIPELNARGLSVSTIKHAHHAFEIDRPGKDSYLHRQSGASEVIVASRNRLALIRELRNEPEWTLAALVGRLSPVDLVIVEGFKRDAHPKLEVYRADLGQPLICDSYPGIKAIVTDRPLAHATLPCVPLDDIAAVADAALTFAKSPSQIFAGGPWPS